jgi:uncharacterized lipoprotein YbaY
MKRPTNRRKVLIAAGVVALTAATGTAGTAGAQTTDIRGAVTFRDGKAIPEGLIEISLEDPSIHDSAQRRVAATRIHSDGGSTAIDFSLPHPAASTMAAHPLKIVARLERADGWLLARGSAQVDAGTPVAVTLNTAMY